MDAIQVGCCSARRRPTPYSVETNLPGFDVLVHPLTDFTGSSEKALCESRNDGRISYKPCGNEISLANYLKEGITFSERRRMELSTNSCEIWPPKFRSNKKPVTPIRSRNSCNCSAISSGEP